MDVNSEEGQSVLEFIFVLPMMIGLAILMIKVNSAIQMGIVNQQYARAHTLFLAFNSSYYPEVKYQADLIRKSNNQMVLGVSEEPAPEQGEFAPSASTQMVARNKRVAKGASDGPSEEPPLRANVRIRGTVTLCTPTLSMKVGSGNKAIIGVDTNAAGYPASTPNVLGPSTQPSHFDYCGGSLKYE